jgi:RNA polymerase sigma factor for flagellar operon FliA
MMANTDTADSRTDIDFKDPQAVLRNFGKFVERLAGKLSRGISGTGVDIDDLIQVGNIALIDEATRFDPGHGVNFTTFATWRVRGAMIDEIRKLSPYRRKHTQDALELRAARASLAQELQRQPTDDDLLESLNLKSETTKKSLVEMLRTGGHSHHSLISMNDTQPDDDEGSPLYTKISHPGNSDPGSRLEQIELREILMKGLTSDESVLYNEYFINGLTLLEIGRKLNLSESRLSQMLGQMLEKVKSRVSEAGVDRGASNLLSQIAAEHRATPSSESNPDNEDRSSLSQEIIRRLEILNGRAPVHFTFTRQDNSDGYTHLDEQAANAVIESASAVQGANTPGNQTTNVSNKNSFGFKIFDK